MYFKFKGITTLMSVIGIIFFAHQVYSAQELCENIFKILSDKKISYFSGQHKLDQVIEDYRNSVHEMVDGWIPGEYVSRTSVSFNFINSSGRTIKIFMIGTTHERINGGTSPEEMRFIANKINQVEKVRERTFLIEQGLSSTRDRLSAQLIESALSFPNIVEKIKKVDSLYDSFSIDTADTSRYLHSNGISTWNIDLTLNSRETSFLIEHKNEEAALKKLLINISPYNLTVDEIDKIIPLLLENQGLSYLSNSPLVKSLLLNYYPKLLGNLEYFSSESAKITPDSLRDEYMAQRIWNIQNDAVVITHTAHEIGILRFLAPFILDLKIGTSELAAYKIYILQMIDSNQKRTYFSNSAIKNPMFIPGLATDIIK